MPRVLFRVDSSLEIGTGHLMRCLTLAGALKEKNVECLFICREHKGHSIHAIVDAGYSLFALSSRDFLASVAPTKSVSAHIHHANWLGVSQVQDADACIAVVGDEHFDWIVVDHYALDFRWEQKLRSYCDRLLVIDDLADRSHDCDLLLDQTYGREIADYQKLAPAKCRFLCGTKYALLRPEFSKLREYSINRRKLTQARSLLITMGGVDKDNITSRILHTLIEFDFPKNFQVTVVMGKSSPWTDEVRRLAKKMPCTTSVLVDIKDMAKLMAESDLAIGAAGSTAWERCCLGLPTIMLVLALNQRFIADGLERVGAAIVLKNTEDIESELSVHLHALILPPNGSHIMSERASDLLDGRGVQRILSFLGM